MPIILVILCITLPWLGALITWLVGDRHSRLQHTTAIIFSIAAGACALALIPYHSSAVVPGIPLGTPFGDITFLADGLGIFLAAIATVVGSLAIIFSVDYMRGEEQMGRYYAFILFFIGAMAGLVLTSNMLLMFVFWEITALCSYGLISFHNDDPKAVAGGIKALIITQVGGAGLLMGTLLSYSHLHSLDVNVFLQQYQAIPPHILPVIAFGFLIAAAAKSAQFPFQSWLPDAMEAPTPVSALIHAATMVNAGVYLLARFFPAFADVPGWRTAVMVVGIISALLSAVMALVATDLKRVLAYSTVSQLGFMVFAIGAGGIFASLFHLLSHSVFKALLFLGAGAVIHAVGTRDMLQMGGLRKQMPLVRTVFVIGALALAGIPILNGFWSKELVLEAGLKAGHPWMLGIMLLVVGLTAMYSLRMVWLVFYGDPRSELHGHDARPAMRLALLPLALASLTTWLLAGPFLQMLSTSLPYHNLEILPATEIFTEILLAPITWLALCLVGVAILLWWQRGKLNSMNKWWRALTWSAKHNFGFEAINRSVVKLTQTMAEALRSTQTGLLNWNIYAIIAALVILLVILLLGG
jgi:NADH-quinone oxidoreductase subunit L